MGTVIPPDPPPDPEPCGDCFDCMPDTLTGRLRVPAMGYDFEGTIYKGNVFGVNYAGTLYMGIHQCFMQVWFCHTVPSLRSVRCWGGYLFAVVYNCQAGPDSCLSSLMCQDTESIGLGIITVS